MLDYFSEWFVKNRSLLAECAATAELTQQSETDKPSLYADIHFDSIGIAARITLWQTGECDMEAIYSSNGKQVFWEHHLFNSEDSLDAGLQKFFRDMKTSTA